MMIDLLKHVEAEIGLPQIKARAALGIVLNAADRQGSPLAEDLFKTVPGARPLAAKVGSEFGTTTGEIARLIEMTPGGRRYVTTQMLRALQTIGLGHDAISKLLPAISSYMKATYNRDEFIHLGDLFGLSVIAAERSTGSIAA